MAQALFDLVVPAEASAVSTHPWLYAWVNGSAPYVDAWSGSAAIAVNDFWTDKPGDLANTTGMGAHTQVNPNAVGLMDSWHTDFHYRFWVIPKTLNLSNPTIGADIPFYMWNTFPVLGTASAVNITGSSVLTFDYAALDTLRGGQYQEINMQIAAGEPTIDADIEFVHDLGTGYLSVIAIVAETFPILPEVPVNEQWDYRTDVLTNYKGVESRLSLTPEPRLSLEFDVRVVDYDERRTLYSLSASNVKVPSILPMFQYAAPITASTATGGSRLYFDPGMCNARVGKYLIIMNRATQSVQMGTVSALHADGATLNASVTEDIDPGLWFAVPAVSSFIRDDSGLDFGTQAGTYTLTASALETWALARPASGVTINTFDSLPIIEKKFLITSPERFAYRRELLDNEVGAVEMRSRDTNFVVKRSLKFSVARDASAEFDYWREFFDLVKGAHKPFLVSTQLPDLTLRLPHGDAAGTLDINETYYEAKLWPLDAFKRIQVTYTDDTETNHVITGLATDGSGNTRISINPTLTAGKTISRISFLQKVRGSDTVRIEHYNDYSYLKFGVRTTNT